MVLLRRVPTWVWITIPFILCLFLQPAPVPLKVSYAFRQAKNAVERVEPAQALPYLHLITRYYPWRVDLLKDAGLIAASANQYEVAVVDLSRAWEKNALSSAEKAVLADAFLAAGQFDSSLVIWQELLDEGYDPDSVYPKMISVWQQNGEEGRIISLLAAWREVSPENGQAWYLSGLEVLASAPWEGLDLLLKARSLDPQYDASVRLVQVQMGAAHGKDEPALELVLAGRSLGNLDEWVLAERAFTNAIQINSSYSEAWMYLAEAHERLGKDGMPALRRAIDLNPSSPMVYAMQGVFWLRRGSPDQALASLQRAVEMDPLNGLWWVEMGNIESERGSHEAALACFQKAVALDPGSITFWKALARFSVESEFDIPLVGLPAARKAVQLAGEDAEAELLLGWALASLGDTVSAERSYLEALSLQPDDAEAYLLLGQLYFYSGRKADAESAFLQADRFAQDDALREQAKRWLRYTSP